MNIKATQQNSQSLYLKAFLDQTTKQAGNSTQTAPLDQGAESRQTLSLALAFSSRTETTLQAQEIEKFFAANGQQTDSTAPAAEDTGTSLLDTFNKGPWGMEKTAGRIADFVLSAAGDDPDQLRLGRDAIMRGFKEAEKIWNGQLPDISYKTIDKAMSLIDDKLKSLGQPVVNVVA